MSGQSNQLRQLMEGHRNGSAEAAAQIADFVDRNLEEFCQAIDLTVLQRLRQHGGQMDTLANVIADSNDMLRGQVDHLQNELKQWRTWARGCPVSLNIHQGAKP